jgi:uncharacterized membrane protein YqgA involved in biofilm formation
LPVATVAAAGGDAACVTGGTVDGTFAGVFGGSFGVGVSAMRVTIAEIRFPHKRK